MWPIMWWRKWWGVPIAFLMCICGLIIHPMRCFWKYKFYSPRDKGFRFPPSRWVVLLRSYTNINLSTHLEDK